MTLIELLTSLTLSAMLMAVLLSTLAQHSRMGKRLQEKKPFVPWKMILKQQLQSDYSACRHLLIQSKLIVIEGYSANGPTRIEYEIVTGQKGNWLFRSEFDLLAPRTDQKTKELVCRSVNRFTAMSQMSTDVAPGILRLHIETDDDDDMQLVLIRHGGAG